MSAQKAVENYLALPYPILVRRVEEGGEVYFDAEIPDLPGCLAHGSTLEEVYQRIEESKRAWIEDALEEGEPIPEPIDADDYSGRFVVRLPRSLHRLLAIRAKQESSSLNQYVLHLISLGLGIRKAQAERTASTSLSKFPPRVQFHSAADLPAFLAFLSYASTRGNINVWRNVPASGTVRFIEGPGETVDVWAGEEAPES